MAFKITMLIIILLLLVAGYAMLVVASRAEERAERMYKEWRKKHGGFDKKG